MDLIGRHSDPHSGSAEEIFEHPKHPYTEALLSAIPIPDIHHTSERIILKGEITSPIEPKKACRFANRCSKATAKCFSREPSLNSIGEKHQVACFLYGDSEY